MLTEDQTRPVKKWVLRALWFWGANKIIRDALLILSLYGFFKLFEGEYGLVHYLGMFGLSVIGGVVVIFLIGCGCVLKAFSAGSKMGITEDDLDKLITQIAKDKKKENEK